jgi:hypothetical protein
MLPFIADRRDRNSFESLNEAIPIGGFSITLAGGSDLQRIYDPLSQREVKFRATPRGIRFRPPTVREHVVLIVEKH